MRPPRNFWRLTHWRLRLTPVLSLIHISPPPTPRTVCLPPPVETSLGIDPSPRCRYVITYLSRNNASANHNHLHFDSSCHSCHDNASVDDYHYHLCQPEPLLNKSMLFQFPLSNPSPVAVMSNVINVGHVITENTNMNTTEHKVRTKLDSRATTKTETVSYTHLDVYKRQAEDLASSGCYRW